MRIIVLLLIYLLNIQYLATIPVIIDMFYDDSLMGKEKFLKISSSTLAVLAYIAAYLSAWKEKQETEIPYTWGTFFYLLLFPLFIMIFQLTFMGPIHYWVYEGVIYLADKVS